MTFLAVILPRIKVQVIDFGIFSDFSSYLRIIKQAHVHFSVKIIY